jgi:hypothetical protein
MAREIVINLASNGDYWHADWQDVFGKRRRKSLGPKAQISQRQARKLCQRMANALNLHPQLQTEEMPTLEKYVRDYLDSRVDVKPATRYPTAESDFAQRRKIPLKVFQVWISRFAHHGQKDLGADVVLDNNGGDEVIRAVALFLWKNRNLSTKFRREENKNGSKNNEER